MYILRFLPALFIFACMFLDKSYAQNLQIAEADYEIKSQYLEVVSAYAKIKNVSSQAIRARVTMHKTNVTKYHAAYFCWEKCYDSTVTESPTPLVIQPGSDTTLIAYIDPFIYTEFSASILDSVRGTSVLDFDIYNEDDPEDKVRYTVVFHMGTVSNVNEESADASTVAPNPATDWATISFDEKELLDREITIFDAQGKTRLHAHQIGGDLFSFNTSSFESGMYTIRIQSSNGVRLRKFIVAGNGR